MKNLNFLTGLLALALSGLAFLQSRSFTFYGRIFLDWTLIILAVLGGALMVKGLLRVEPVKTEAEAGVKRAGPVWWTILGLFSYVLLIPVLGFIIASIAGFTLAGVSLASGPERKQLITWAKAFGVGLLVTAIFYVLFKLVLAVPLPEGVLGIG